MSRIALAGHAALVVCDRGYLRLRRRGGASSRARAGCRVVQVEGDVVVPVAVASTSARPRPAPSGPDCCGCATIFSGRCRRSRSAVPANRLDLPASLDLSDIPRLIAALGIDHTRRPGRPASAAARPKPSGGSNASSPRRSTIMPTPAASRRPHEVSFLAAYLHFGQISPVEIALAIRAAKAAQPNRAAYLEELIVRRELAINFVEYEPHYDEL